MAGWAGGRGSGAPAGARGALDPGPGRGRVRLPGGTPAPHTHLLVRAAQARKVVLPAATGAGKAGTLFALAAAAPRVGTLTVSVPAQPGREAREAVLTVRMTPLTIQPPRHRKAGEPDQPQAVWVVRAREETPPAGVEAVDWVLVTTLALADAAAACALVGDYALRWRLERRPCTLKSGCHVEALQQAAGERLQKGLALYYVVAWPLVWLTYVARTEA